MKRKFLWMLALAILSSVMLTACPKTDNAAVGGHGTATVTSNGGAGTEGGDGGSIDLRSYALEGVKISRDGAPDVSFALPTVTPTVDLGKNGVTIATNTTVTVLYYDSADTATDPGLGVLYMVSGDSDGRLFKGIGNDSLAIDDPAKVVTGLRVNDGVTLTLGLNYLEYDYSSPTGYQYGNDTAYLYFTSDLDIAGTVKVLSLTSNVTGTYDIHYRHNDRATSRDMGLLDLEARQIFIRGNGLVSTRGLDASVPVTSVTSTAPASSKPNDRGGDGGYIYMWADNYFSNEGTIDASGGNGQGTGVGGHAAVGANYTDGDWWTLAYFSLNTDGIFINKGTILGNGGNGSAGGAATGAWVEADSHIFNTGTITANGGASSNYYGGPAAGLWYDSYDDTYFYYTYEIGLESNYASVYNSGALTTNGGDGTWGGAWGGEIWFYSGDESSAGDIVNSGKLTANGGSTLVNGDGDGGDGGYIEMDARGEIRHNALVTMNGGNALGTYNRDDSSINGGDGGQIEFYTWAAELWDSSELPTRRIQISGNFVLNGGTGFYGGDGGTIYAERGMSSSNILSGGGIEFLGYASLTFNGGDGTDFAGDGGDVYAYTRSDHNATDINNNDYVNSGAYSDVLPAGPVTNDVDIIAKGGNGVGANTTGGIYARTTEASAGVGGYVWFEAGDDWYDGYDHLAIFAPQLSNVTNAGKLDVSGGEAGNGGLGGYAGMIEMYARGGSVTNSGVLDVISGSALHGWGGHGGYDGYTNVEFGAGVDVVNSGAINGTGGSGMYGGQGAEVGMYAANQVRNSANITLAGGGGEVTTGNGGYFWAISALIPTENTGIIDVTAGADLESSDSPAATGSIGEIWIDGVNMTPADGTL